MRARYASATAVGVAVPARKASVSSCAVRRVRSANSVLDDARHAEELAGAIGRVRERLVARQARARLVVTHDVDHGHRVRRRLDVPRVERVELLDVREDAVELLAHLLELRVGECEPGEARDVLDVFAFDHCKGALTPRPSWVAATARPGLRAPY